jgi:hypothetical protein
MLPGVSRHWKLSSPSISKSPHMHTHIEREREPLSRSHTYTSTLTPVVNYRKSHSADVLSGENAIGPSKNLHPWIALLELYPEM